MSYPVFHFKQFSVFQDKCSMKVGTDGVLLGAWTKVPNIPWIRILDIGTGTGIIALILAQKSFTKKTQKHSAIIIEAIDIDESSCFQARQNIQESSFSDNIIVIHQSLKDFSQKADPNSYNLIVSNPPFFINSLKSGNKNRNITRHSDIAGLDNDALISSVLKLLSKDGKFSLILPRMEGENFIKEANKAGLYCTKLTRVFSKPGKDCIRLLMQFEFSQNELIESTLTIETGKGINDFSEEYKALTKEFYLHF